MNRRIAISLLTILALLWQGAVSAAMGPAMLAMAAAPSIAMADEAMAGSPCHGMSAEEMAAMDQAPPADRDQHAVPDCCAGAGHCYCALACGGAALPMPQLALNLLPAPALLPRATSDVILDAAPPHPFRPPIAASV